MTPIRRCPWCGSQAISHLFDNLALKKDEWFVQCYAEPCHGRGPIRYSEADAITAWNTRQLFGEGEDGRLVTKLDDTIVTVLRPVSPDTPEAG